MPTIRLRHCLSRLCAALTFCMVIAVSSGCDDSSSNFDHPTPAGLGTLVVDNGGPMNVSVFIDGIYSGETRDGHWDAFDLTPGLHRVVLDETNGDHSFRDDVDILDGRQTILDITGASGFDLLVIQSFD